MTNNPSDEKLLHLPPVPTVAEVEATYPNWENDLDRTYAGIGPLAVTLAQQKADRDLSPFQPPEVKSAHAQEQQKWDEAARRISSAK